MVAAVVFGATAAGCGSKPPMTATVRAARAAVPPGPALLAQFEHGVGVVTRGSADPVWTDPDAVAALDGSAVFSVRHPSSAGAEADRLVRLDPATGEVTTSWPLPRAAVSISAVSPGGHWVALTDRQPGYGAPQGRTSTTLVVFDAEAGSETHRLTFTGDLQPEAFSVDGRFVFVLDYRGDHYRVQTIFLPSGDRTDTIGRDKTVDREDMQGTSVRGVLSADHTLLATLYRKPNDPEEPAFVHILDLEHTWAYCADLPAPFGTGPPGSDVIELTPAGTVIVAATSASRIAEIHIAEVHQYGTTPVTVDFRDGTPTSTGAAFAGVPGFGHVIAALH
jgi:hypothetical protein